MSSIRDRIAALNAKPQQGSSTSNEAVNTTTSKNEDKDGSKSPPRDRRKSLTIAERIALMKANSAGSSSTSISDPLSSSTENKTPLPTTESPKEISSDSNKTDKDKTPPAETVATRTATNTAPPAGETEEEMEKRLSQMSIADRIAAMKSAAAASSSKDVTAEKKDETKAVKSSTTNTVTPATTTTTTTTAAPESSTPATKSFPSNIPPATTVASQETEPKKLTVAEKIAAMKASSGSSTTPAPVTSPKPTPSVNVSPPSSIATNTSTSSTTDSSTAENSPRRLSVAEKVAAMKAKSAAADQSKKDPPLPKKEPETTSSNDEGGGSPKPKRLSVAEKIAAMKAKSEAESKTPTSSPPPNNPKRTSVSMADKIAMLKQKGAEASNNVVNQDASTRPKSATINTGGLGSFGEDDDDIFDRPASVPRKLNPNLVARASIAMPMMMPGMTHPGLKRSSTGSMEEAGASGLLPRSSSLGSTRVTNEGSENGEMSHSTMSRARTVKKKRKSSISSASRLNLIKSDSQTLLEGASVKRVSTVEEGNENESDDEKDNGANLVPAIHMDT